MRRCDIGPFGRTKYKAHVLLARFSLTPISERNLLKKSQNMIRETKRRQRGDGQSWAWHYERSGSFTVQSVYRMIMETKKRWPDWLEHRAGSSDLKSTKRQWSTLWQLKILGKLKKSHGVWHATLFLLKLFAIVGICRIRRHALFAMLLWIGGSTLWWSAIWPNVCGRW